MEFASDESFSDDAEQDNRIAQVQRLSGQLWHNEAMLIRARERQQDAETTERMLRHRLRSSECELLKAMKQVRYLEGKLQEAAEHQ